MKTLVFYRNTGKSLLSYNDDWYDAFINENILDVETCNLATKKWLLFLPKIAKFDLIIFLHSSNSNGIAILPLLAKSLLYRKGKVIFFVGNEYKLMPEKIALIKKINADFIVSQLPQDIAEWLYEECESSKTISLPHALNPQVFNSKVCLKNRPIDIGIRSFEYPKYLGDTDRNIILQLSDHQSLKSLRTDIETKKSKRLDRQGWCQFLGNCKSTFSNEAGTSYLEKDDRTRKAVNAHISDHPDATSQEIYKLFFKDYSNPVSGKCVSSRHFDAIGTKTCQIMFLGRFNDILKPDEHYISLNRDFSNLDDVLERFHDVSYREKMVNETYEYILGSHTHKHRIKKLLDLI